MVDDNRTALILTQEHLLKQGYKILTAMNGAKAKEIIAKEHFNIDVIILDRIMPDMDGIEVAKWLNNSFSLTKIPIVMQTGAKKPEDIKEGIDAGVFYYLTKPVEQRVLKSVIAAAIKESNRLKNLTSGMYGHKTCFKLIREMSFYIHNLDEAEYLSCFVANCFPNANEVLPAIYELLVNAIEHGVCGISYENKGNLVSTGSWRDVISKKLTENKNVNKQVKVIYTHSENRYYLKISDGGEGFEWQKYLAVDPGRAADNHGRGIARANLIFDELQYNKKGNEVIAVIDKTIEKDIEW
ncbi:MAG: response regulator [Rickettsiaceae bacterium]|nr:response regulator [Rickettsiaceae bacterium]